MAHEYLFQEALPPTAHAVSIKGQVFADPVADLFYLLLDS